MILWLVIRAVRCAAAIVLALWLGLRRMENFEF
jgi:hypothetical protein